MAFRDLWSRLRGLRPRVEQKSEPRRRGATDHVVILDGTMSSLKPGYETNAGVIYKLLAEQLPTARLSIYYEAGVQWPSWWQTRDVASGRGINMQIRRAYGYLASRYRPGDRIFLFGYSRGAFAVRSLAGMIDRIGLLRSDHATERNVLQVWRRYRHSPQAHSVKPFAERFCHPDVEIEMVGVFDTVKALGLRLPLLWTLTEAKHGFHDHSLGKSVRHGFHALALNETRAAFAPVMWHCPPDWKGNVEQVWFRGAHGDIGGQIGGYTRSRPLANIPLVWMLERAERRDLPLPQGWHDRFPCDVNAPSVGTMRGVGSMFLLRSRRIVGRDRSEAIHATALGVKRARRIAERLEAERGKEALQDQP
ncbi:MAG: DUF2235 domain-containing protein [Paracoccaceae bacterium]